MKIFIASTILFFCNLMQCSANQYPGFDIWDKQTPLEHAQKCVIALDFIAHRYEEKDGIHKYNQDYHMGFILGQRQAYQNMVEKLTPKKEIN
jgi:hypothetical protein